GGSWSFDQILISPPALPGSGALSSKTIASRLPGVCNCMKPGSRNTSTAEYFPLELRGLLGAPHSERDMREPYVLIMPANPLAAL
ncbi:MAG: hypothetical protein M3466_08615, partial [Gemmatimonadota bacterium]|nr:hypothetical protein [Gemmatimonadota bacterium]